MSNIYTANVYVCTSFTGFYPVGVAAVVVADSPEHATALLNAQLRDHGLPGDAKVQTLSKVLIGEPQVLILCDGNY